MKKVIWVVAALGAEVGSIFLSRVLRLPEFAAAVLTSVPAFLLLFPFLTPWMPQTKFKHWAVAAAICSLFVGAAFFLLAQFGWN